MLYFNKLIKYFGEAMKIINTKDYGELSRRAADIILNQINNNPLSVLGLATGSTPIGTYKELVKRYNEGLVSFKGIKTINLDEYMGLSPQNPQSYRYYMENNFFSHIDIKKENTFIPNGCAKSLYEETKNYDNIICSCGGIDLQILGIGLDGHIGFNEPSEYFIKNTHIVNLAESTIEANSRFFKSKEEVPRQAITMGIGAIMQAKRILLLAHVKKKGTILKKALFSDITPKVPASVLQLHSDVTVYSANKIQYFKIYFFGGLYGKYN